MMTRITVDIFYGDKETDEQFGMTFGFDKYAEALKFVDFAHEHSGCNAKISQTFIFEDDDNEQS